jgi:hypothetical protein
MNPRSHAVVYPEPPNFAHYCTSPPRWDNRLRGSLEVAGFAHGYSVGLPGAAGDERRYSIGVRIPTRSSDHGRAPGTPGAVLTLPAGAAASQRAQ